MSTRITRWLAVLALGIFSTSTLAVEDPLPSWNDGETKQAITQFVEITPMLHVLWVNIGDNSNGRGQTIERTVGLVGLDHHPFALTHPRV